MTSPDRDLPMDLNVQFEFTGEMWALARPRAVPLCHGPG